MSIIEKDKSDEGRTDMTQTRRQCPATHYQLGNIACPDFGQTAVLRSIDVRATCRRPPAGAVAESAAKVEDMGAPAVAMDLVPCECRLGSNVIGDQRPALGPGEGRGQVSRKVLEPTRSAERTDDPLWYSSAGCLQIHLRLQELKKSRVRHRSTFSPSTETSRLEE